MNYYVNNVRDILYRAKDVRKNTPFIINLSKLPGCLQPEGSRIIDGVLYTIYIEPVTGMKFIPVDESNYKELSETLFKHKVYLETMNFSNIIYEDYVYVYNLIYNVVYDNYYFNYDIQSQFGYYEEDNQFITWDQEGLTTPEEEICQNSTFDQINNNVNSVETEEEVHIDQRLTRFEKEINLIKNQFGIEIQDLYEFPEIFDTAEVPNTRASSKLKSFCILKDGVRYSQDYLDEDLNTSFPQVSQIFYKLYLPFSQDRKYNSRTQFKPKFEAKVKDTSLNWSEHFKPLLELAKQHNDFGIDPLVILLLGPSWLKSKYSIEIGLTLWLNHLKRIFTDRSF